MDARVADRTRRRRGVAPRLLAMLDGSSPTVGSTSPRRAGCPTGRSVTCSPTSPATPTASRGSSRRPSGARSSTATRAAGQGRNAEIEAGAGRPADEQVDDVRRRRAPRAAVGRASAGTVAASRLGPGDPGHRPCSCAGARSRCTGPISALGYEPAEWPSAYVREELVQQEMRWNARRPMGLTGLPRRRRWQAPGRPAGLAARAGVDRRPGAGRHLLIHRHGQSSWLVARASCSVLRASGAEVVGRGSPPETGRSSRWFSVWGPDRRQGSSRNVLHVHEADPRRRAATGGRSAKQMTP